MARSMRPVPGCTSSGGLDPIPMTSPSDSLPGTVGHSASVPPHRLAEYSVDGLIPSTVVSPEDVEEVSRVLSQASGEGTKVAPWGGGTQMGLGNPPTGLDLVLDLGRLDGVLFHEPGDLVAGVEAGITLEAFQERLAQRGQILPLEAPYPSRATIGGILAANASGPSRLGHGTARDWLIGIAVVRSDGAATKAGARVVKNVTGYDLNKLYTGSLGTLGVIVGATFKLSPLPPDGRTVVAVYPSLVSALDSAAELLLQGATPQALHVVNRDAMERLPGWNGRIAGEAALLVLFSGRTASVSRLADKWAGATEARGASPVLSLSQEEGRGPWQGLTDLGWATEDAPRLSVKVGLVPSLSKDFLAAIETELGRESGRCLVADVGFGLLRLLWWTQDTVADLEAIVRGLREVARRHSASVVVERCPVELKGVIDVWGDSVDGLEIMRRIKRELDPTGTLNPGRFAGRI